MPSAANPEPAPTPKRIVVLHGTNYWNMGDLGLVVACLQSLHREFDDPQITVLSQFAGLEKPEEQTFDVEQEGAVEEPWLCMPRLGPLRKLKVPVLLLKAIVYAKVILSRRWFGKWTLNFVPPSMRRPVEALVSADLVVSKPGGFVYGYGRVPGPHHLIHMTLAWLGGAPLVIYGQSIGPFSEKTWLPLVRWVLGKASLYLVRDEPSVIECRERLKLDEEKMVYTADEAFLLEPLPGEAVGVLPTRGEGPLVGMTAINWAFPNCEDPPAAREAYMQALTAFVDHLTGKLDARVVLFPFAQERPGIDGDRAVTTELHSRIADADKVTILRLTDPRRIKQVQLGLDAFVGSRMHSNIFALGAGLPVLAIAYQPKTTGIMAMAGQSEYVTDIRDVTAPQLIERFQAMWASREAVAQSVETNVAELRRRAKRNAELSARLIGVEPRSERDEEVQTESASEQPVATAAAE